MTFLRMAVALSIVALAGCCHHPRQCHRPVAAPSAPSPVAAPCAPPPYSPAPVAQPVPVAPAPIPPAPSPVSRRIAVRPSGLHTSSGLA